LSIDVTRGARLVVLGALVTCAAPSVAQQPATPLARFAGTWVGTQAWAIPNPPPGSRQDQPVTLTIEVLDGKAIGNMKPFMGGEDGATFVDAKIVGEELHATAIIGRARGGGRGGAGRGGANANAPSQPRVNFVFTNTGLAMSGTADVFMGEVPWTKFKYTLEKKRSRY
jgi:hypothetical protein